MANTTPLQSTTQQFLDIYDITNDLLIMKDGSTSLILTVDAMNFGLLAEEEQDAIMYAYAGLLNSLNYSIQIVIKSQTKDATNYLNLLKEQEAQAISELKRQQIAYYREFVAQLIRERNVLDKKFYIVIPATSLEMGLLPPQTVLPGVKQIDISTVDRSVILEKARTILEPKRDHLVSQFGRIGLFARQLSTQEIIQLYYTSYNPEAAEGQQITNTKDYTTTVVTGQTALAATPLNTPASAPIVDTTQPVDAFAAQPAVAPAYVAATPDPALAAAATYAPADPSVAAQPVEQTIVYPPETSPTPLEAAYNPPTTVDQPIEYQVPVTVTPTNPPA